MAKRHNWVVFAIGLLVGLIYVFPHFVYIHTSRPYNPLAIGADISVIDEAVYAAGVMEVLQGNLIPVGLSTYEHKDEPYFFGPFPFLVMAIITEFVGGIRNSLIFSDFLFSSITFLLYYIFSQFFLKNKGLSIISALTLAFFHRFFVPPKSISITGFWKHFAVNLLNYPAGPVRFWLERFMHPQIPVVLLFLTLLFIFWSLEKRLLKYYLIAGAFFALNFYSYVYNWTYLLVFLSLLVSYFLLVQKSKRKAAGLSIILLTGVVLSIPYLFNLFNLHSSDAAMRAGIEIGRFVETISIIYLALVLLSFVLIKNKDSKFYLINLLMLSGIVTLNVQLVLGFTIQNNHWNSRIIIPILVPFLLYNLKAVAVKLNLKLPKMSSFVAILTLLLLALNMQVREVSALHGEYKFPAGGYELLTWLNENSPSDSVVLTNNMWWNLWIPAYTHNNVYFPYSVATSASDSELMERFILTYKITGKSTEDIKRQLHAKANPARNSEDPNMFLGGYIFSDKVFPIKHKGLLKKHVYNQEIVDRLIEEYDEFDFSQDQIRKYRVNYILLVNEEKNSGISLLKSLDGEIVFNQGELLLIKI